MSLSLFTSKRACLLAVALSLPLAFVTSPAFAVATQAANLISVLPLGSQTANDAPRAPRSPMLLAADGNLYLTTYSGGASGAGSLIRIDANDVVTTVASFAGPPSQGSGPYAGVILASDGNFYGTTYLGGASQAGTVYRVTPTGTYTLLHSFSNAQQGGFFPYAGLVQAPDGNLYGTTLRGGPNDAGTLFRLTLGGTLTTVLNFSGNDGRAPQGALTVGPDGNLYGTTLLGGTSDRGTIYRLEASGRITTLFSFPALAAFNNTGQGINAVGSNPRGGLTLAPGGSFYGLTSSGASGFGSVYRVTTAGVLTVLHAFGGPPFDGGVPLGEVSVGADGTLYGATQRGGFGDGGTAWRLRAGSPAEVLHSFLNSGQDGAQPYAGITPRGGFLYGATYTDGAAEVGALFKLDQGTNGTLPVRIGLTPARITIGQTSTLDWSAPGQSSCTTDGAWNDTVTTAGTKQLTPAVAGIYNYVLICTDGAGVVRNAYASLAVSAPAQAPVDGGGDGSGGGSFSLLGLALLGGSLLGRRLVVRPT